MPVISPAPMIIAKTRRIIRRFENVDATSPGNARTLEELNLRHGLILGRLLRKEVIVEASPQRYYLNRRNLPNFEESRKTRMKVVLVIIAVIVIFAMIYNFIAKS